MAGKSHESYDAVVVGSGYGGSVAACRMSMAGISVCLVEKGRRWEAEEFPTNTLSLLLAGARVQWRKSGVGFGSEKALFQIHVEGDSMAAVACGLGGGSLVNAGVLVPPPVKARRDPKWPKDWNKNWDHHQALASTMLEAQSLPVDFSNGRVMRQIIGEDIEDYTFDPIKLSINFSREEEEEEEGGEAHVVAGSHKQGSCLACGNCLSGCPYNAKNSTDKNYLASAMKAGCVVKTERKVLYIVKNYRELCDLGGKNHERRWRVCFDDLEYICTDFIVLSAGVLGTTEILFQSKRRGLSLSEKLGHGLSCNGNNVAYVAGSTAPLYAYGLSKKQFSDVPFQSRPGPAISCSFTSSLGFTVQSAVLPTSYPYLLFKGIATYSWPDCYGFLHGLIDKLKCVMGLKASQAVILNIMGFDSCDGRITFDEEEEKINITPPRDPLLPKKITAFQNLSRKLGGILFISRYRSTCVHLLGGCNAAPNPSLGVCNPNGQVFDPCFNQSSVHEGLYVSDASLIPCSIGTNPCLTITTVAENVSRCLANDVARFKSAAQNEVAFEKDQRNVWTNESVTVKETMRGFIGGMPCTAYLTMKLGSRDEESFICQNSLIGGPHPLLKGKVGGYVVFPSISKDKLFILDGYVDLCKVDNRTPYTQYMHYSLMLASSSSSRYVLEGKKMMNPFLLATYVWQESTTLHVTFKEIDNDGIEDQRQQNNQNTGLLDLRGQLHISIFELLRSLVTLKGKQKSKFLWLLFESLWNTYILQVPRHLKEDFVQLEDVQTSYPPYIFHEIKTEDGYTISSKQWGSILNARKPPEERPLHPVLLLNGYAGESYWLPTEPKDLVRTLLDEGYEIWLLQSRLHPNHPSNNFTIEDIAKFDIPAVFTSIRKAHGPSSRVHVIAHCAGGLAIHIALLGGHISATHIASLSCTNSSMYFKLTPFALAKMKLPLLPVTMAVLGSNQILSITDSSKDELRHSILKSIARFMPRNQRCTSDECDIISGVFGNPYWHENVSRTLHQWLHRHNITHLPMAGFPHLRMICKAGYIVNAQGNNEYLMHPERMAVPTLYVSGGRSILVTPETSMLASRYMRLHQPGFQHKRVVVEGFGHSDLLIGEESHEKVFPHFISHMKTAERGGRRRSGEGEEDDRRSVLWEAIREEDNVDRGSAFLMILVIIFFVFLFSLFSFYYF